MPPFDVHIPVVELWKNEDTFFTFPLFDKNALRINTPPEAVASEYLMAFRQKMLHKGKALPLIWLSSPQQWKVSALEVLLPLTPSPENITANWPIKLDYVFRVLPNGYCHITVPVLGMETMSRREETIDTAVMECLQIYVGMHKIAGDLAAFLHHFTYQTIRLHHIILPMELAEGLIESTDTASELAHATHLIDSDNPQIWGMEEELAQMEQAMRGEFHQHVLITGHTGIGKTALVWEMARRMPDLGLRVRIHETSASQLIKALTREGQWQEKLSILCRELTASGDFLFVRNIAELFEIGQYEGNSESIAEYLEYYISNGEIRIIAECTEEEFARLELRSPGYFTHFQRIKLETPGDDQMEKILVWKTGQLSRGLVELTPEAAAEAIRLHRRFLPYAGLPGKIVRFIENLLIESIPGDHLVIEKADIIRHFGESSGMPAFLIDPAIPLDTERINRAFNNQIFGQKEAVDTLTDLIAAIKTGMIKTGKPIASLLFAGPTGVGKTALTKMLAAFIFGDRRRVVRFDMSEFSSSYAAMRLIGEHASHEGLLTSAVRKEPFSLVLFDEMEKAHPVFFDFLLQVLSEGRLTDASGNMVNFCSTIIVMTSNIGAGTHMTPVGWKQQGSEDHTGQDYLRAVQAYFRPELYNRIDRVIPFRPLAKEVMFQIVQREWEQIQRREGLRLPHLHLQVENAVLEYLAEKGYDPVYGARFVQRTIRKDLVIPLAQVLNSLSKEEHLNVRIQATDGGIGIAADAELLSNDLIWETLDRQSQSEFASHLRRSFAAFETCDFHISLRNERYRLQRLEEKNAADFYRDSRNAREMATLEGMLRESLDMGNEIRDLEMQLALSAFDRAPYSSSYPALLDEWLMKFNALKQEWVRTRFPEKNNAELWIFGPSIEWIRAWYQAIAHRKAYRMDEESIWYPASDSGSAKKGGNPPESPVSPYLMKKWPSDTPLAEIPPPVKGAIRCGLRLKMTGSLAGLLLEGESGYHQYTDSEGASHACLVLLAGDHFTPPSDMHRWIPPPKAEIRRSVSDGTFSDSMYHIRPRLPVRDPLSLLCDFLDEQLIRAVNIELGV